MPITLRVCVGLVVLAMLGVGGVRLLAGPGHQGVVVGYQTNVDPAKFAQASGAYDRALGTPVTWRKFDSGTDVITALAAGDIDFGDLGSTPLAIGATRQLPFQTVELISRLGRAEALVARNGTGIVRPADLVGKRVAVPFVSTCHYSLLAALAHWHIAASAVHIINLSAPQIAAAWARGDIDAAYVWDPALGTLERDGRVLVGSDDVARWGAPTYEAWVVRRDFAKTNPRAVAAFVRVSLDAVQQWRAVRTTLTPQSPEIRAMAAITGVSPDAIGRQLDSNEYPDAAAQAGPALLGGGLARDLAATAGFLKAQGKVDRVLIDYRPWIDARWVRAAAKGPTNP